MARARFRKLSVWLIFGAMLGVLPGRAIAQEPTPEVDADIIQSGDNEAQSVQQGGVQSGDGASGAQVTGIVAEEGSRTDIDASNESEGSVATSGNAIGTNTIDEIQVGPRSNVTETSDCEDPDSPLDGCIVQDGDNEGDFEQIAAVTTGDAVGGAQVTGVVNSGGDASYTADNVAEDAESTTGDSVGTNDLDFAHIGPDLLATNDTGLEAGLADLGEAIDAAVGPAAGDAVSPPPIVGAVSGNGASTAGAATPGVATGGVGTDGAVLADAIDGVASGRIEQDGDNELTTEQATAPASGDSVAGAQVGGLVITGGVTAVDLSNESEDAQATSGDAVGSNDIVNTEVGPNLNVASEAATLGISRGAGGDATAGQAASGAATTSQTTGSSTVTAGGAAAGGAGTAAATSGDATAGDATGGDGTAGNVIVAATAGSAGGLLLQDGDNEAGIAQSASAPTGDAVAGGQVAGFVSAGVVDVSASNTSDGDEATSGDSAAANTIDSVLSGPRAEVASLTSAIGISVAVGGDATSGAATTGAASSQANGGDASAAGTGALAAGGAATVTSTSGPATSGPATGGAAVASDVTATAVGGTVAATIEQLGDNSVDVAQNASAPSGDAVGGGQVIGAVVAATGAVSGDLTNDSEGAESVSGDSTATNDVALAQVGPQIDAVVSTTAIAVSAAFGGDATSGPATSGPATGTGIAPNTGLFTDGTTTLTGNAVASTTAGGIALAFGGDSAVSATSGAATSGAATGGAALAGPATAAVTGSGAGDIFQDGDNDLAIGQAASAPTGDAVAGGQVAGVVAAGTVSLTADNTSEDDEATSGDSTAANTVASAESGPVVDAGAEITGIAASVATGGDATSGAATTGAATASGTSGSAVAVDLDSTEGGTAFANPGDDGSDVTATASSGPATSGAAAGGAATTTAVTLDLSVATDGFLDQEGDNDLTIGQDAAAPSGDAVAGGQVMGVVAAAGAVVDIAQTNASEDSESVSGDTNAANVVSDAIAGPEVNATASVTGVGIALADGGDGTSGAATSGNATGSAVITETAGTFGGFLFNGSAVAIDSPLGGPASAIAGNAIVTATSGAATSGAARGADAALTSLVAVTQTATTSAAILLDGDTENDLGQTAEAASGDAVAGGQVTGVVAGPSADVSLTKTNEAEDASSTSGEATTLNTIGEAWVGPFVNGASDVFATAGVLALGGDAVSAAATSGDAVAAAVGQGVVAIDETAIGATGVSVVTTPAVATAAVTGTAIAGPGAAIVLDPFATTGSIVRDGDDEFEAIQDETVGTGDAVTGAQVTGVVANGEVNANLEQTSDGDETTTGDATGTNLLAHVEIGPVVDGTLVVPGLIGIPSELAELFLVGPPPTEA